MCSIVIESAEIAELFECGVCCIALCVVSECVCLYLEDGAARADVCFVLNVFACSDIACAVDEEEVATIFFGCVNDF